MKQPATVSRPWRALAALGALMLVLLATMVAKGAWSPRLGLDLAGGTSITLTAKTPSGGAPSDAQMQQAIEIMNSRVNSAGVVEPDITKSGSNNIVVSVANVNQDEIVRLVGQTAELRFRTVSQVLPSGSPAPTPTPSPSGSAGPSASPSSTPSAQPRTSSSPRSSAQPSPSTANRPLAGLPGAQAATPSRTATPTPTPSAATPSTTTPSQPAQPTQAAGAPTAQQAAQLAALDCKTLKVATPDDPKKPLLTCNREGTERYLLGPALLNGTDLDNASAGIPQGQVRWVVNLQFNADGTRIFRDATQRLFNAGPYPANAFAIVLDGKVITAPSVNGPIPNGQAEISGNFNQASAQELANVLKYGSLPLTFTTSEVTTVSPSLGSEQLRAGVIAGAIGLVLVVVYSLLFYRALGVISILSLAVAGLITWASVVVLGVTIGFTLILAGIIGVIVSIGITADSFVVYFERIRDEIREGRSTRVAVENGWRRARRTILVADGVTFLAALVLYWLAIGRVQNFAFTLGLTTLIDILVVFLFTKPAVTLLVRRRFFGQGHPLSGLNPERVGRKPMRAPTPKLARASQGRAR